MKPAVRLGLNAAAHLLVDGLCAATVFGRLVSDANLPMLILGYNTLAFSTQCLVGLAADRLRRDRLRRDRIAAAVSMIILVLGYALPLAGWLRVALIGLGAKRTAWVSILPAAVLIAFCAAWAAPSLLGQLALNLTMPVTLWLLWRAMPDAPGLAFGLTASALWPGMITGQLMTLTGPALWICVLLSFGFGLWAILYAERSI